MPKPGDLGTFPSLTFAHPSHRTAQPAPPRPCGVDEDIRPAAVRDAVVLIDGAGTPSSLSVEFDRADGVHAFLVVPLTLGPRDRGTRLLNRLRAHGIAVRTLRV
jgi:hypothetical protein